MKFLSSFFSTHKIPRRDLTKESSELLRETIQSALKEMLKDSCPCHYPRYRYLVEFHHNNYNAGPVFCADVNYLVDGSTFENLLFLKESDRITDNPLGDYSHDIIYTCTKCASKYRHIGYQYSLIFEFVNFQIVEDKHVGEVGKSVTYPIPLLQGLYGFDDSEVIKCSKGFRLGSAKELFRYLTEKSTGEIIGENL